MENKWKEKYKILMNEKIRIERERNKLFEVSEKLIKIIKDNNIPVDLREYEGIKSQAGISLIPGDGEISSINYKPFNNVF